jgi:teichuronic acid exporter
MSSLNLNILNARGRSDLFLKTDLSKLPMAIIAIPYGILGVAIAQLVTTFISFFINTYYLGKLFGFGAKAQLKQIYPIAFAASIMYISIFFIKFDSLGVQMFTKIVVGDGVYIALCWIFKVSAFTDVSNIILVNLKDDFSYHYKIVI